MLEPTNQQKPNKKPMSVFGNKKELIKKIIPIIIAVLIVVIAVVAVPKSKQNAETSVPESLPVYSVPESEPLPEISDVNVDFSSIEISEESSFSIEGANLVFGQNIIYSDAEPIANATAFSMGKLCSITPIKNCTYRFNTNQIDMTHNSGAMLSINRASLAKDKFNTEAIDTQLTEILASGKALSINLGAVFVGASQSGRMATGTIKIGEKDYTMQVMMIGEGNELFTIVGISDDVSQDFLELMYKNITIQQGSLSFR